MKNMVKVVAAVLVVLALAVGQSALMAAPLQGGMKATANAKSEGILDRFLNLLGAVWGPHGAVWGPHGAVWGDNGATWSDRGAMKGGTSTQGAIWGGKPCVGVSC